MSDKAMTAERLQAIRERVEADGPADTHCVWCGEDIEDGPDGPCDPIKGGDPCERSPGDECQQDRSELFDEVERLALSLATVTAERDAWLRAAFAISCDSPALLEERLLHLAQLEATKRATVATAIAEVVCACRSGWYDPATHEKYAGCRIRERHEANERKRQEKP